MSFLAPALLALGLAVVVPLVLHLLQRHQGPRVVFPALRYLRRAEREHSTRIRLRQLLLLALRVLAVLLVAAAAARPLLRSGGGGHAPTAVALVLDNSLSTGAIVGERRVLDELRDAALATLAAAGPDDRFWLVRAGAPWEPALSGTAAEIAAAVRETEPTSAASTLPGALDRAAALLVGAPAGLAREIQLLSDLQDVSLPRAAGDADARSAAPPVRVYAPAEAPPLNRSIASVVVGGGVPVRAGETSTVAATVGTGETTEPGADAQPVALRLVVDGVVRGVASARPGETAVLTLPARPPGWVTGHVETDPDAVRADDRRFFATRVLPALPVASPAPGPFLEEALASLESAGRVRRVPTGDAAVVLAPAARAANAVRRGAGVVVLPPATPLELGAANQRLAGAGIPWRFGEPRAGQASIDASASDWGGLPDDARLRRPYDLVATGAPDSVVVRLRDGAPWAVLGQVPGGGRYVVLGSPLTTEAGTLPTSAALVPLLDRAIARWALGAEHEVERAPGDRVAVDGDAVVSPDGAERVVPGGGYRIRDVGIYRPLDGTDTLGAWAVNPPASESRLERVPATDLGDRLPGWDLAVTVPSGWTDTIYHDRLGREVTVWLLVALVMLLGLETAIAATGRARSAGHDAHHAPPSGVEGNRS